MNSSDYRVTELLTEHLGFAPLTLVDEVINAVNKIMYNCTDALETFLLKRRDTQLEQIRRRNGIGEGDADIDMDGIISDQIAAAERKGDVFPIEEIHHGTSELETLLVSHVDKNFDKFELYTLRNILTMPRDLVDDGMVRLKHHEHLDKLDLTGAQPDSDAHIQSLLRDINMELEIRKTLELQLVKSKKLVSLLTRYKHYIDVIISTHQESEISPESTRILKESLTPINENVYYLICQLKDLIKQVLSLNHSLMKDAAKRNGNFLPTERDAYLREKTLALLEKLSKDPPSGSGPLVGLREPAKPTIS